MHLDFDVYILDSFRNKLLFRKFCSVFCRTMLDIVVVTKIKHHRTDVQQSPEKSQVLCFLFFCWQEYEEDKSALVDEYFQDHVNE